MGDIESAIVGYISGAIVGGLIVIFIIAYFLIQNGSETPQFYEDISNRVTTEYYNPNPTIFEIGFILGFLSGIGGGGTATNKANNRRKTNQTN